MTTNGRSAKASEGYGSRWRVLAWRDDGAKVAIANDGTFDELVLEDILHLEKMDDREWWMQLGDARLCIEIPQTGKPRVLISWGEYAPDCDWTFDGPHAKRARRAKAAARRTKGAA